jgi:uncharacterized protein YccT (UPF0319 family)
MDVCNCGNTIIVKRCACGRPIIPLEQIKDKLPHFDEKKEAYKLRHHLYYHVIKKKSVNEKFEVVKNTSTTKSNNSTNERVSYDDDAK